jgi:hypothetical protein
MEAGGRRFRLLLPAFPSWGKQKSGAPDAEAFRKDRDIKALELVGRRRPV